MGETPRDAEHARRGHEERDVWLRPLIVSGVCLAVLAGLSLLAIWLLFDYFAARSTGLDMGLRSLLETRPLPPEPRLQVSPQQDMRKLLTDEMAVLHSYGWVDRQAGIIRIPIGHAIDLLTERGLPARKAEDRGSKIEGRGLETEGRSSKMGGGG